MGGDEKYQDFETNYSIYEIRHPNLIGHIWFFKIMLNVFLKFNKNIEDIRFGKHRKQPSKFGKTK